MEKKNVKGKKRSKAIKKMCLKMNIFEKDNKDNLSVVKYGNKARTIKKEIRNNISSLEI